MSTSRGGGEGRVRERERERGRGRGGEKERGILSRLHADSAKSSLGFGPTNHEITT